MKSLIQLTAATAMSVVFISGIGFAQTATGDMGVNMTVDADCTISTTNLDFGSVGIISADVDASAAITIQCTAGSAYTIGLSAGDGATATVASRKMTHTDETNTVDYSLYKEDARTNVWGGGTGETVDSLSASGADEVHPVYGRVFAGQNVPTGSYADTITATITYGSSL